ncbi:hypothetical protein SUGI_0036990 [Cryptomeria japonica]|nr:hypothetical protein SUGI_0036990 [Cryptomeria japonica]
MGSTAWRMSVVQKAEEIRKGPWTLEEDTQLIAYVRLHGACRWSSLAKMAGLKRDGRSCRMRWLNYLRPDIKHGTFTPEEDRLIIELHNKWGNRWSWIARSLPGRTDNEIKNHWRTHITKMSEEIIGISSWPPSSKTKAQIKKVREKIESSSSKMTRDQQMPAVKECYPQCSAPNNLNKESCDTREFYDGYQTSLTSQEVHQEFINESSDMDTQSDMIIDASAASMVQHSPTYSVRDSPMNVLSDSEEFLWDYNSIDLWNLDDDVQNIHR